MENEKKRILIPTIIAIVTLVLITVGATYAYFMINADYSKFTTRTAEASTPDIGSITLSSGTNLSMDLSLADMMKQDNDVVYYASSTGKTTEVTTEKIATVNVVGEGTYTCNYTITVDDNESSMYDAFQSMEAKGDGQIVLTVNGTSYDFNTSSLFPKEIPGSMEGLTEGSPQYITAQLKLVNKSDVNQNDLADTNITLSFNIKDDSFSCVATD